MRRLFLVLAKLVGLVQLYWALANIMTIGFTLSMLGRPESSHIRQILVGLTSMIVIGTYFLFCLGVAWLLLFRTEWLADRLRIQDETEIKGLDKHTVLLVGVKLIGVYVAVIAIPSLVRALFDTQRLFNDQRFWEGQVGMRVWGKIIPAALQVGLGALLAFKTEKVVGVITKGGRVRD